MTNSDPAEQRTAAQFAAAITRRDYPTAVSILVNVANAGDSPLAALLLEGVVDAGIDAISEVANRGVTVTQTVGDVPQGATVIGFQGRNLR